MKKFTATIQSIDPTDAWYSERDNLVGRACTSASDAEVCLRTGEASGYFRVEGYAMSIYFLQAILSNVSFVED